MYCLATRYTGSWSNQALEVNWAQRQFLTPDDWHVKHASCCAITLRGLRYWVQLVQHFPPHAIQADSKPSLIQAARVHRTCVSMRMSVDSDPLMPYPTRHLQGP